MKIGIANDHAGFALKEKLISYLADKGINTVNFGTNSIEPVDYPEYAHKLAKAVENHEVDCGISICGTGNGISMAANKHPFIRSAVCWNKEISSLARLHNDANICSLPGRFISYEEAIAIVDVFINTPFEGGRHIARIKAIPIC
jgi:ribose 5-phosphate isomerase B